MIGQVFNNCKIESKIALATTGVVYKATDIHLEVMRAIKIIHPQLAKKKVVRDRLLLAVQAWAKLDIPSFVQIFSAIYQDDQLGFVMDYFDGVSLANMLKDQGHLGISQAVEYFLQVARAIAFSHKKKILHRKLYPGNIIIGKAETIKILGLGACREINVPKVTPSNLCLGKIKYMAPEQLAGEYTIHTDQYALGAIFYEMVTGVPPFNGTTMSSICRMHLQQKPAKPNKLNGEISEELEQIILKALSKKPEDRYPDVETMINEVIAATDRIDFTTDLSVHSLMSHGRKAFERRKLENAIYFFNKVLSIYGTETVYYEEAYANREESIKMQKEEEAAIHIRDLVQEMFVLFDEEDEDGALDYLVKILRIVKKYPDSSRLKGIVQDIRRELPDLLDDGEAIIQREIEQCNIAFSTGKKAYEEGNYSDAVDFLEQALEYDNDHIEAAQLRNSAQKKLRIAEITGLYTNGLVSMKKGRYQTAVNYFKKVLEINPDHDHAKNYHDLAEKSYEKQATTRIAVDEAYKRGLQMYEKWQYDEAVRNLEEALALNPNHKEAHQFLEQAKARLHDGNTIEDIGFFYQEGMKFYHQKQWHEAIVCFNRILQCMDSHKKALEYRNYAQHELEKEEAFEKAMDEAMLFFRENRYSEALEKFDYLLQMGDGESKESEEVSKYKELCLEFMEMETKRTGTD